MAKIIKLLHYRKPCIKGYDYATVSEREYPLRNLYKFYSEDRLPKKYQELIKKPYNECKNDIETWNVNYPLPKGSE